MKLLPIILLIMASLFVGCGGGDSVETKTPTTRTEAPQPNVADDSLRPPKPPSI